MICKNLQEKYSPMYHLAALGSGGLAISFFLYLNFLLPHESGIISFDQLWPVLSGPLTLKSFSVGLCLAVVMVLLATHFALMAWNTREFSLFKKTEAYAQLRNSSAEISLMVVPLTMAMTVNACFVSGSLLIPGLWEYIEYLFPVAMLAFVAIGVYAIRILGDYFTRMFLHKGYDFEQNNSLSPMISIFALAMIAVGLAAPVAMSHTKETVAIAFTLSSFFATSASLLMLVMLIIGFNTMLTHGIRAAAAPSLWLMIPITTLLGITFMRTTHGMHEAFDAHVSPADHFVVLMALFSIQVLFGLLGYRILKRINYFKDYIHGDKCQATTFALVCPGVAFPVFGLFVIKFGLLGNGLIMMWTPAHYLLILPFMAIQLITLKTLFILLRRLQFTQEPAPKAMASMQSA
ncbi:MAG TPA: hypothetical protein PLQ64_02850 [Thiobacillaceae bacterium]|nr:hypothetical protein [Thiobacillaceae bacterium]HNH89237.1 hypothetical protein [Thiobacillaceae bacterium]HNI06587.1 hypothetical protein [Thiobacillaceae bacterium]